jgi:hypothetical protein
LSAIEAVVATKPIIARIWAAGHDSQITDAVIAELKNPASASHLQEVVATGV